MTVSTALLQTYSPFDSLDTAKIEQMAAYARVEKLPKGTFIVKRGKDIGAITYLVSGHVDLVDASFNNDEIKCEGDRRRFPLVESSPSAVSAMSKSDVEVLIVEHDAFELMKAWEQESRQMPAMSDHVLGAGGANEDWMVSLLDSPLFSQIPPSQLQLLFARFEPIEFEEGETVIKENSQGDYFYVIESGRARVETQLEGEVASLDAGKYFGEEALVGETIRNATVVMTTPGVLMRLDKADFRTLLQEPLIRYINSQQLTKHSSNGEDYQLLDVRLPLEHRKLHVKDSMNIPLFSLRKRLDELDKSAVYVLTDDAGKRSEVAAHLLCQAGFTTYILENSYKHYLM